ncbi:unnamed protein product [Phytophthora lilii]|uniref:Unnamed protein product n=1 Tax=Phytophthora lilii TaxID=2077276 RepID=A0A9W6XS09_9STRA|nr:unnamed protein product [Phytophthora lilii]
MQTSTFGGKRYFVTFIDEYSHFCVVYLLRNKSEVADKFAEFVAFAETQTGKVVKTLRSDNYWKVRILNTVQLDEAEGRQHSGRDRSGCWKPLEGKNEDSKVID